MNFQEILQWTDSQVFAKTGKHFESIEQSILEGIWLGQKYTEIAKNHNFSYDHVKKQAWELWKVLSDVLGEDVKKSNVRSVLERKAVYTIYNFGENPQIVSNNINNSHINICSEHRRFLEYQQAQSLFSSETDNKNQLKRHDLSDAPDLVTIFDRTSELTTLQTWINQENSRLIGLLGISGIGKTALTINLIPLIQEQFDAIIWRSLRTAPTLEQTLKDFIQFLTNKPVTNLPQNIDNLLAILIEKLRLQRCLIILDDVQTIFAKAQLTGNYQPNYENYGKFFKIIGDSFHQSCLIINSWEPPREITELIDEIPYIKTLQLQGLTQQGGEIFRDKGLIDEDRWPQLIETYQGHPLWLKITAKTIKELFAGRVGEFIKYETIFLSEDLKANLQHQFNRLALVEKQLMLIIANSHQPLPLIKLFQEEKLKPSDIINGVQSLYRRSLVQKKEQNQQIFLTIQPVIIEYLKNC